MALSERAEEILETLWVESVERGKTPDTTVLRDDDGFRELAEAGYVSHPPSGPLLTPKGLDEGRHCVRRHRLAERLLADVFSIKGELIHQEGCRLEHVLKKGLEDNICVLLGHPGTCPHGRPIPRGRCCRRGGTAAASLVVPLSSLKKGQSGRIAYIETRDRTVLRQIMAMGALPGLSVALVQRFPSFVFQLGDSQFAVDRNIADRIRVWVGP